MERILVTGAGGQIGSDLIEELARRHGPECLVGLDLGAAPPLPEDILPHYERTDVRDLAALRDVVERYGIGTVYHLASLLSATGEKQPDLAWDVNMTGLKHVLDLAKLHRMQVFWPSSIAVFGPATRKRAPQHAVLDPTTMYGVTKVSGELLCRYYGHRFGVDVRSLRFPGIISYKTRPGGGTTDYAVEIFYAAVEDGAYTCFVRPETRLPMMYMPDAVKATLDLMDAPSEAITVRTSYNVDAVSFTAAELAEEIARHEPGFTCAYAPDHRQQIADSWPSELDDTAARDDWGWQPAYDLPTLAEDMLVNLRQKLVPSR